MSHIALSVLVCSVHTRYANFLPKISAQLYSQYAALSDEDKRRVEILVFVDNKQRSLGHKRNDMVALAQGDYVVFVDDDDRIAEDYIATILAATAEGSDVIAFNAEYTRDGGRVEPVWYSMWFPEDTNDWEKGLHWRIPNHIVATKRRLAALAGFPPEAVYAEDVAYAKRLKPFLTTQTYVDKVLYFYDYTATSEPQDAEQEAHS